MLLVVQLLSAGTLGMCKTLDMMPEADLLGPWSRELAVLVTLGACGWAAYLLSKKGAGCGAPEAQGADESAGAETPESTRAPHVQIMDMMSGRMARSNPAAPTFFDSDVASGCFVFLHRPLEADIAADPHGEYFQGKVRLWEVRVQLRFKRKVEATSLRVGTSPLERIPVGVKQVALHRSFIKLMGSALQGFYNSPGDDPKGRNPADVEPPITSIPIWASDQHVPTIPGTAQPDLLDPAFPSLGFRKTTDRAGFKESLQHRVFQPGEVHTFALWGPSRLVNVITWQVVGLPLWSDFSLDVMNGPPPMVLSMFLLGPPIVKANGVEDTRHLPARTTTVVKVCGWPSLRPLAPQLLRKLREGTSRSAAGHREAAFEANSAGRPWTPPPSSGSACFGWLPRAYIARNCNSWLTCGLPRGVGSPTISDGPSRDVSAAWAMKSFGSPPTPRRADSWFRR